MVTDTDNSNDAMGNKNGTRRPFRKAVFHGLAVVLPPLFTILILIWVVNMIDTYMFAYVTDGVREVAGMATRNILEE